MKIWKRIKSYVHSAANTFRGTSTLLGVGWEQLFNNKRKDDATLTKEGYTSNTDAYSIVKRIADNLAKILPIIKEEKGGIFEITEDPALLTPILEPLNSPSYADWAFSAAINLLNAGDLFLFPSIPVGLPDVVEYRVLESAATTIKQNINKQIVAYIYLEGTRQQETFLPEQIIHVKYADPSLFGIESKRGLSALQAGYLTLTADGDTEAAAAVLMKNKGVAGFLTDESESMMDPEDAKALQKDLQGKIGGAHNFNKIRITSGKYKYVQVGMSPTDLKTIENQVLSLRKMCNLFSVNSALFNDPANKTFNNQLEANKALFQDAVLPVWNKIFSGIQKYLREQNRRVEITPDTSTIACLQADKLKEAQRNQRVTTSILNISKSIAENLLTLNAGRAILINQWGMSEDEAGQVLEEIKKDDGIIIDS